MNNKPMILVIGEYGVDTFVYGKCERLCPEAPVPVFNPTRTETNLGLAGNVYNNLMSLNFGDNFNIHFVKNRNQIISKTRYVEESSNQMLLRVDDEKPLRALTLQDLNDYLEDVYYTKLENYTAVIISDYNKGFVSKEFVQEISEICGRLNILTFMDTKKLLGPWSSKIDYIKINYKEFKENSLSETINDKSKYKNIITTIGKDGAFLITQDGARFHAEQTKSITIRDVSGAGDTYLAALVIHFMHHKNILNAMRYANSAAAVAVSKRGVVSVHFGEVD